MRRVWILAATAVLVASTLLTACQPNRKVTAIGDSVMLGAKPKLEAISGWTVRVDAAVSRQWTTGVSLIRAAAQQRPARLVLHLGANGPVTDAQFDQAIDAARGIPKVIVLTIQLPDARYPHERPTNDVIRRGAARRGVTLVDWNAATNSRSGVLASDGIHLTAAGASLYRDLVARAL